MAPKKKAAASPPPPAAEAPVVEAAPEVAVAVAAAPAVVEAVAAPTAAPITGTPAEIFAQLQVLIAADRTQIAHQQPAILTLVEAAESADTPLILRVRCLELVATVVGEVRGLDALKRIVTSLLKVLGGEDDTPQLRIAAIRVLGGLGPCASVDKSYDFLPREAADVLMQVMIDKDAFPETVRQAAGAGLDALTATAFHCVVAKLLHWLSDDREADEEEQLQKERHLALARLTRLVMAPSMRSHWTEEVQVEVIQLVQRVMTVVNEREFAQLARAVSQLPMVREKDGLPLLEMFMASMNLSRERDVEALCILARFIKKTVTCAAVVPALEGAGFFRANLASDDHGVMVSRLVLFACRTADADGAAKLLPFITAKISAMVADESKNLSVLEALFFALAALAKEKSAEVLQLLNEEAFSASMSALETAVAPMLLQAEFAVKKAMQRKELTGKEGEILATLRNLKAFAAVFSSKHLPTVEMKESWAGRQPLPATRSSRAKDPTLPPSAGTNGNGRKRSASHNHNNNHNGSSQPRRKAFRSRR